MRDPLERDIPPPWWPSEKESWWNEIEYSEDFVPPPYRKSHDLKKGLESLCFDGCYQTYVS
jgi:ethylene-insensitive protein 3